MKPLSRFTGLANRSPDCVNDGEVEDLRQDSGGVVPRLVPSDAELACVVTAWPHVPQHVRQAILTLVEAGCPDEGKGAVK